MSTEPPTGASPQGPREGNGPDWGSSDWGSSDRGSSDRGSPDRGSSEASTAPTRPIPAGQRYAGQEQPFVGQPYAGPQQPYAGQQQPYGGHDPPGGRRRGNRVVWVVLGVIAVVMVLVVGACAAAVLLFRGAATEVQERADRFIQDLPSASPTLDAPVPQPPIPEAPPSEEPRPGSPDPQAPPGGALALGSPVEIGSLAVVVTAFEPDATDEYEATGEAPPELGQFGKVTVEVTNTGDNDVLIGLGLSMGLVAADGTEYASLSCAATLSNDVLFTTAAPGDTVVGTTCVDIPAEAVEGGRIYGQQLIDLGGSSRAFWTY